MGIQTVTVELAAAQAWQTYRAIKGAAANQEQLRSRLERYLTRLYTADSTSDLATEGLAFLKRSGRLDAKHPGKARSVSP
jgi:hypothetical protein